MPDKTKTRIHIKANDFILFADLNETAAAKDLISRLPVSLTMTCSEIGYCGVLENGYADENEMQYGWSKGDIGYYGGKLSVFCSDCSEPDAQKEMIIGHISAVYLDTLIENTDPDISLKVAISLKNS